MASHFLKSIYLGLPFVMPENVLFTSLVATHRIWIQHFSGVLLLILFLKLVLVGDFPRFQKWNVINNLKVGAREFNQRRHYNTLSRVRTHHDKSLIWLSRKDNSICNSGGINDELSLIYLTALHNICSTMSINVKWH